MEERPFDTRPNTSPLPEEDRPLAAKASLPSDPQSLLALLLDEREKLERRARVFSALDRSVRKQQRVFDDLVTRAVASDAALTIRWLAAELALARPLAPARLPHLAALRDALPADSLDTMIRVVRSTWISEKGYPARALAVARTNASEIPAPVPSSRLDLHALLAVDDHLRWPPQNVERFDDSLLLGDEIDEALQAFSALHLPIATEIVARREILRIRALGTRGDDVRISRPAKDSLALNVQSITEAIESKSPGGDDAVQRLSLIRFVGRSPDVWALFDRERARLTLAAPDDADHAHDWAIAMGEMPSLSPKVSTALSDIRDVPLMALLEVAIARDLSGLIGRIQDIALSRARSGAASTAFWRHLGKIAPLAPQLERWWRSYMAPMAPTGVVTHDAATQGALLVDEIRTCAIDQLTSESLATRIASLSAQSRLRALGGAIDRLSAEIPAERDRQISRVMSRINRNSENLAAVISSLGALLGGIPESIRSLVDDARRAHDEERHRVQSAIGRSVVAQARRIQPRRAAEITDLVAALRRIDRPSSEQQQREEMELLRQHFAWAVDERPDQVNDVVASIDSFSGEALSVVVAVAIQTKNRQLLESISSRLASSAALRVVWRATLLAYASQLGATLHFDDDLAGRSADLLYGRLEELQRRLLEVRSDSMWIHLSEKSTAAREGVRKAIHELSIDVAAVASRL